MPWVAQSLGVGQCANALRSRPWRFAANSDGHSPKTPSSRPWPTFGCGVRRGGAVPA